VVILLSISCSLVLFLIVGVHRFGNNGMVGDKGEGQDLQRCFLLPIASLWMHITGVAPAAPAPVHVMPVPDLDGLHEFDEMGILEVCRGVLVCSLLILFGNIKIKAFSYPVVGGGGSARGRMEGFSVSVLRGKAMKKNPKKEKEGELWPSFHYKIQSSHIIIAYISYTWTIWFSRHCIEYFSREEKNRN
jgi:hypothetical protein